MGQYEEVARRLRGFRDALELSSAEIAAACGVDEETYKKYESGEIDIPVSTIYKIAQHYGVEIMALMFGEEPKMKSYYVTRKGCGESVERYDWYKYQSLAQGFQERKMEPFLVTAEANTEHQPIRFCSHDGQELNYVESGTMELHIDGKIIVLNEGDTIMFNALHPHGARAIGGKPLRFIAIIL